jgi:hypothetical protein
MPHRSCAPSACASLFGKGPFRKTLSISVLAILSIILFSPYALYAQVTTATLSGVVQDTSNDSRSRQTRDRAVLGSGSKGSLPVSK